MSNGYNLYIIKDRIFVRDFETMYSEISDPWYQCRDYKSDIAFDMALNLIKNGQTIKL